MHLHATYAQPPRLHTYWEHVDETGIAHVGVFYGRPYLMVIFDSPVGSGVLLLRYYSTLTTDYVPATARPAAELFC